MRPATLALGKPIAGSIRAGHPWIYRDALEKPPGSIAPGGLVRVTDRGTPIALGYCEPGSPIAVRVLTLDPEAAIDASWVRSRVRAAVALRTSDPELAGESALRLVHGENDFLPGLVIDAYDGYGIAVFDGDGAESLWFEHGPAIVKGCAEAGLPLRGLWARARGKRGRRAARGDGRLWWGEAPPERIVVRDADALLEVDVRRGEKTGLFLDQRDNRRRVGRLAAGAQVLNLFAYTGGFAIHAALGGARRVTSVEIARPVIDAARRNFARSGMDANLHPLHRGDAFAFLESAAAAGRRYDIVICDPPSFAPSQRAVERALRAYRRLNRLALEVVAPAGLLVTCSCSSHVNQAGFLAALAAAAAQAQRALRVRLVSGAAPDHPVLPAFPEGNYLTCAMAWVS